MTQPAELSAAILRHLRTALVEIEGLGEDAKAGEAA